MRTGGSAEMLQSLQHDGVGDSCGMLKHVGALATYHSRWLAPLTCFQHVSAVSCRIVFYSILQTSADLHIKLIQLTHPQHPTCPQINEAAGGCACGQLPERAKAAAPSLYQPRHQGHCQAGEE